MSENPSYKGQTLRAARRSNAALWGGVALVAFGVIALMDNFGLHLRFGFNWWAFFMLVPGAIILKNAYEAYQASGYLTRQTRTHLVAGSVLVAMAVIFLVGLELSALWPLLLIAGGAAILLGAANR